MYELLMLMIAYSSALPLTLTVKCPIVHDRYQKVVKKIAKD